MEPHRPPSPPGGRRCRLHRLPEPSRLRLTLRGLGELCRGLLFPALLDQLSRCLPEELRRGPLLHVEVVLDVAARRLDSSALTPPTWYGIPQFAYETYGPRSTIRISAFSSSLRRRAAHDAPPATPPTLMTFTSWLHCDVRRRRLPERTRRPAAGPSRSPASTRKRRRRHPWPPDGRSPRRGRSVR